jgi:hypothetical protein
MRLTRAALGRELTRELEEGYDPVRIAKWAYRVHLDSIEIDVGLEAEMLKLIAMEQGPEFEMSESELLELARTLQATQ